MNERIEIPEKYIEFSRELINLVKKYELIEVSGKLTGREDFNVSDVHFYWEDGRHGATSGKIRLSANARLTVKMEGPK
jgi:hypothetical protein